MNYIILSATMFGIGTSASQGCSRCFLLGELRPVRARGGPQPSVSTPPATLPPYQNPSLRFEARATPLRSTYPLGSHQLSNRLRAI